MRLRHTILRRIASTSAALPIIAIAGSQLGCGLFGGSTPTQTMATGSGVPAAQGTVRATEADNGNTAVAVRVKHLARPSMVASDATVYVVWIRPRNAAAQSIGALTLNEDLEGSLDTLTPHRRFTLLVTPEPSAMVTQPTHDAVFTSSVERAD